MYPKAKHLDCFSTWVLQTWQARLIQRGSKPHWRCIHVEAGIACNRRDWMECYTTNIFYVALACKLTHQILKTTCIYNIHIIYILCIDQNHMNLSNLDSAIEKTYILYRFLIRKPLA